MIQHHCRNIFAVDIFLCCFHRSLNRWNIHHLSKKSNILRRGFKKMTPFRLNRPLLLLFWVQWVVSIQILDAFQTPHHQKPQRTSHHRELSSTTTSRYVAESDSNQNLPTTEFAPAQELQDRRKAMTSILSSTSTGLLTFCSLPSNSIASEDRNETPSTLTTILKGVVTLEDGVELAESSQTSALYVTCRPNQPDNVPQAILSGTRGKPPPVMAARYENPTFPFEFTLSSPTDLTIEGASTQETAASGAATAASLEDVDPNQFWWKNDDLIVSARWDSDGVAATRNPEDLVGRGIWKARDSAAKVTLTGRGAFGKFATGGGSKKQ